MFLPLAKMFETTDAVRAEAQEYAKFGGLRAAAEQGDERSLKARDSVSVQGAIVFALATIDTALACGMLTVDFGADV